MEAGRRVQDEVAGKAATSLSNFGGSVERPLGKELKAAAVLTEAQMAVRALPFNDAPIEEQVRRLHQELVGTRDVVMRQERTIDLLRSHQHGPSGEMLQPMHRFYEAEGCEQRRDPLA